MKEIAREIKAKIAASYDAVYLYCRYNLYSSDKAPDVTQDIFCAFVEEYETIRDPDRYLSWLYTTAKHKIADENQRCCDERKKRSDCEINDDTVGCLDNMFDRYSNAELNEHMKKIYSHLDKDELELCSDIKKYNSNKLNYSDMAEKYAVSEAAIRKRISRLKQKVLKIIKMLLYTLTIL